MQSEAYKLTGFTAVASAMGFLLRWLQNMQILEPETGLSVSGKPISYIVAAMIVLMAGGLFAITWAMRRCDAPTEPEQALEGKTFLYTVICIVPALCMAVAGMMILLMAWPARQAVIWRMCGVSTLLGAAGVLLVAMNLKNPEKGGAKRLGMCLLILFGAMWLIAEYKSAASDPVVWRFAVEMLAICAALMAFYYITGYCFGEPNPRGAVLFCYLGAFLCVMSAVDEHSLAESLLYAGTAILLFAWGYALVSNMRREPDAAVREAAS